MEDYAIKDEVLKLLHNNGASYRAFTKDIEDAIKPKLPKENSYETLVACLRAVKDDKRILNPSGETKNLWEIKHEGRKFLKAGGYTQQDYEEKLAKAVEEGDKKRLREREEELVELMRRADKRAEDAEERAIKAEARARKEEKIRNFFAAIAGIELIILLWPVVKPLVQGLLDK